MDPRNEGITVTFGPAGESEPLTLTIPALHKKWKLKKGYWTCAIKVDGVNWTVQLDDVNRQFLVSAGRFQYEPGDGESALWGIEGEFHPVSLSIVCGDDAGYEETCFRNSIKFNHTKNWGVLRIP
jgi:hypothetical protein